MSPSRRRLLLLPQRAFLRKCQFSLSFPIVMAAAAATILVPNNSNNNIHVFSHVAAAAAWVSSSSSSSSSPSKIPKYFSTHQHHHQQHHHRRRRRRAAMMTFSSDTSSLSVMASSSALASTSAARTHYTIDDSDCPPTRPDLLESSVRKACASLDMFLTRKPILDHTQLAFESLNKLMGGNEKIKSRPIILDSGCGTGRSSILLGEMYPNHLVIGVDRSYVRLSKQAIIAGTSLQDDEDEDDGSSSSSSSGNFSSNDTPICELISENVILLRAELVEFWRCIPSDWNITHHYMLYPNPYPKKARLRLRWYAHPSFPLILKLGAETIIIRSNWEGYLKEFARSIEIASEYYDTDGRCNSSSSSNSSDDEDDDTKDPQTQSKNYAKPYLLSAQKGPSLRTDKGLAMTNFEIKFDAVGEPTYELKLVASSE